MKLFGQAMFILLGFLIGGPVGFVIALIITGLWQSRH